VQALGHDLDRIEAKLCTASRLVMRSAVTVAASAITSSQASAWRGVQLWSPGPSSASSGAPPATER
jgi:hypothetical protein